MKKITYRMFGFAPALLVALALGVAGCEEEPEVPDPSDVQRQMQDGAEDLNDAANDAADDAGAAIDDAQNTLASADLTPYPLDVCVVSNEPLDAMDGPRTIEYEGREIKFCCSSCIDDFEADPAQYVAKLEAAE